MAVVIIPTPLRHLTGGRSEVEVEGDRSLRRVFESLDRECPGIKDELIVDDAIRPGIAIFVDDDITSEGLLQHVPEDGRVHILPALGGGSALRP